MLEIVASCGQVLLIATLFRFIWSYAVGDAGIVVVERVQIRWAALLGSRLTVARLRVERVHRYVLLALRSSDLGSLVPR